MPNLSEKVLNDSLEHYRKLIGEYDQIIQKNEELLARPDLSESKKNAIESLMKISEREKRKCQQAIERLLTE